MVLSNLFRYFLHHLEYFMIKMCMMILTKLFRYFLHYLVYFKMKSCTMFFFQVCSLIWYIKIKIARDGSSKSVPLLFTISSMFWDEIVHYGSFKFVPLLFTSSTIFNDKMCMMILSNVFRYFLYHLVNSKQNCAFQICSATFYRI